jgi:uroporphyrinogen III methyltransferase/synthase
MDLGVPLPEGCKVACIGPVTAGAIQKHGLSLDVNAEVNTIPGLVAAIEEYWKK